MATKRKIGATIALDGEREFRSAVTKSTSALKTMKSEMSLVENQFKGQQNTMEALTAKHTVLEKTLEKTKKVEQDTAAALANAQKNYEKAGVQLGEYKTALAKAEQELEAMKNSSSATSDEIAEQESKIKELNRTINSGEREYEKAAGNIETWQQKLNAAKSDVISVNRQLDENAAYMKEASESSDGCAKSIDGFGKKVKDSSNEASQAVENFSGDVATYFTADKITEYAEKISAAFQQIATDAVDAAKELDEGYDAITKRTGATGDAFTEFKDVADDIFGGMPETMLDVGDAVGEVNTRFHSQGDELKSLSTQFLQYAHINDTDVASSVDRVQKACEAFNLEVEDAPTLLDVLSKVAQDTGANVDTLADSLVSNSSTFSDLGLDAYQAATLMGQLEVSSADASSVLKGLQKGLINSANAGKSLKDSMAEAQDGIKNAATDSEALRISIELFGSKAGKEVAKAVRSGTLDLNKLASSMDVVNNATGTVANTYDATLNSWDKAQVAMNNIKTAGSELAGETLESLVPAIEWVADNVHNLTEAYKNLPKPVKSVISGFALLSLGAGALVPKLLAVATQIKALQTAGSVTKQLNDVTGAIKQLSGASEAANAVEGASTALEGLAASSGKTAGSVASMAAKFGPVALAIAGVVAAVGGLSKAYVEHDKDYQDFISGIEDGTSKIESATQSLKDSMNSIDDSINTVTQTNTDATPLIESLDKLNNKTNKTADEMAEMKKEVNQLNSMYPDWNLAIDSTTGKLTMQGKAVSDLAGSTEKLRRSQAEAAYNNTITDYYEQIAKAQADALDGEKKLSDALKNQDSVYDKKDAAIGAGSALATPFLGAASAVPTVAKLYEKWKSDKEVKKAQKAVDELNSTLEESKDKYQTLIDSEDDFYASLGLSTDETNKNTDAVDKQKSAYIELAQKIRDSGDDINSVGQALTEEESDLQELFNNTVKAWQDAHDSITSGLSSEVGTLSQNITQWQTYKEQVLDSLQSASSMFSEVSKNDDLTWSSMTKNLDDNINRYQTWNDNVSSILQSARYQNDEAFREIANSIMTGGIDSADYLQKFVENVDLNTSQASSDLAEFARMDGVQDTYAGTMASLQAATEDSMGAIAQAYDNTKTQAQQSMQELSDSLTEQAENYQTYAENAQNIVDSEKYKTDDDFREFANQLLSQGLSSADAVSSLWQNMQDGSKEVDTAVQSYSTLKDSINNYADAYASIQTVTQNGMDGTVQIVNNAGSALQTAALNDSMLMASGVDLSDFVKQMQDGATNGQTAFTEQMTSDESLNSAYDAGNTYGDAFMSGVEDALGDLSGTDTVATLLQNSERTSGGHNVTKSNNKKDGNTVNVTVNGSKNQDVRSLSDQVIDKIKRLIS